MLAAKNFKRDRKRYRSTVVGLFLSVTLFISASSFCAYLTGAVTRLSSDGMGGAAVLRRGPAGGCDPEQRLGQLSAAHGVESGFYTADSYSTLSFAGEDMDPEYWSDTVRDGTGRAGAFPSIFFRTGTSGSCCGKTAWRRMTISVPARPGRRPGTRWRPGAATAGTTISCIVTAC